MNAARPPTFRPRTACNPLWAVVLKRSPRLGVAGSIPALESADRRCRAVLDRTRAGTRPHTVASGDMQPPGGTAGVPPKQERNRRRPRFVDACRSSQAASSADLGDARIHARNAKVPPRPIAVVGPTAPFRRPT